MRMTSKACAVLVTLLVASVLLYRDAGEIGALAFVDRKLHDRELHDRDEPASPIPLPAAQPILPTPTLHDETASAFVARAQAELAAKVRSGEPATEVAASMNGLVAAEETTRATFGGDWGSLSDAEQREATTLVGSLLVLNALRQVREARGAAWTVGASRTVGGETHVAASIPAEGRPLSVVYVLRATSGTWQLVDIQTEGSSMRRSFGVQIHRLIASDRERSRGVATVLTKLRKKAASEAAKG